MKAIETAWGLALELNLCGLPDAEHCIYLMNGSISELPLASWLVRLEDLV